MDNHRGVCGKCGQECRFVRGSTYGFWIHVESGDFMSKGPDRHDCNTYIVRESDR